MKLSFVLADPDTGVTAEWLQGCAAAVAVQLARDVCPAWGLRAPEVDTFIAGHIGATAADALPIVVMRDSDSAGLLGYHNVMRDGRPFARVFTAGQGLDGISCTISHEAIEALCDTTCDVWIGDRVLEPADAVEDQTYPIAVGGVTYAMSNFVLPAWYQADSRGPWDYLKKLSGPLTRTDGGYVILRGADGKPTTDPPMRNRPEKQHAASRTARRLARRA